MTADMSPEAIAGRLRHLDELYDLGLALEAAVYLGPIAVEAPPIIATPGDHPPDATHLIPLTPIEPA